MTEAQIEELERLEEEALEQLDRIEAGRKVLRRKCNGKAALKALLEESQEE